MYTLVFDIETIPDCEAGRKLFHLEGTDAEVAEKMFALRREETGGNDFLRLHFQKIAAISVVLAKADQIKVWSLGELESTEKELLEKFFEIIDTRKPQLVSWNGGGFDLPVLHYRALINQVVAERYWEIGENDSNYKWNNYLNRYHYRHLDLMDVLACYQSKANAPLDQIAAMLGFPGKMGVSGAKVWDMYVANELKAIRDYCETDVLNTYLVFLQFQFMRGVLRDSEWVARKQLLKNYLENSSHPHFQEFLQKWHPSL